MTAPTQTSPFDTGEPYATGPEPARHRALVDATARIRVRRRSIPVDRILLGAASILTPLGVVFIVLGWYGASHTGKTYEQIDYLISGGILGGTLTVLGGFLYFGYWLTRQLQESRRESALAMQAFRRLEDAITGAETLRRSNGNSTAASSNADNGAPPAKRRAAAAGGKAPAGPPPSGPAPASAAPLLVATPHGNLLHRPDCAVVARRPGTRPVAAGTDGYGYCRMCDAAGALT